MKELKRNEEGVSPVIATILMVAITVVLAATLYVMVGDIGGDDTQPLAGGVTHNEDTTFEITSLQTPSSATTDEIQITVINETDDYEWSVNTETTTGWRLLNSDDEVVGGSRFDLNELTGWSPDDGSFSQGNIDEVVIRIDGYSGTMNYEM